MPPPKKGKKKETKKDSPSPDEEQGVIEEIIVGPIKIDVGEGKEAAILSSLQKLLKKLGVKFETDEVAKNLYNLVYTYGSGNYYFVKWEPGIEGGIPSFSWEPESPQILSLLAQSKRAMSITPESSMDAFDAQLPIPQPSPYKFITVSDIKLIQDITEESRDQFNTSIKVVDDGTSIKTTIGDIPIVTPNYILGKIEEEDFIQKIIVNIKYLYQKKKQRYIDLYNRTFDADEKDVFSIKPYLKNMVSLADKKLGETITIEAMRKRIQEAITDRKNGIFSLTGDSRRGMRDFLAKQIFVLSRSMAPFNENFLNIALMGPAGTGKSKLASVLAYTYGKMGVLLKDYPENIIVGSAKDVVSSFQGDTVNKTNKFLGMGLESVIFIDEAYGIMNCDPVSQELGSSQGYGSEAITEIVNFLDVYRGLSILIVAGYEKSMQNCFFAANQGLSRRFPFQYKLESYSADDLTAQFMNVVNDRFDKNMFLDVRILPVVKYMITDINNKGWFPNQAGDISNLAAIFATIIESYPGKVWGDDDINTSIFMLSQVYETYTKPKKIVQSRQIAEAAEQQLTRSSRNRVSSGAISTLQELTA